MPSDISPQHVNMTGPTTPPPASTPQPPPTPILLVEDVDVPPCPSPRGSEALAIPHIASLVTSHIPDEYLSCVATVRKSWFAIVAPRLYTTVRITHPDVASTHTVPNATLPSAGEMGLILPWPLKQLVSGVIKKKHVRAALPGVAWARQTAFRAIKTLVVPLHSDARCSQEAMGELHEMLEGNFRLRLPRFIVTTDPGLHLACPFIPAFDPVEIVARCDGLCNGLTYRSTGGTAPTVSDRWPCRTKRVIIEPDVKCYSYHPCLYPASIDTYVYRLDGYRPIPGASLPLATSFNSVRHVAHTLESRLQATVIVLDPDDSAQQMSDARANPTITTSSSSSTLLQEKRGPVRNLFAETLSVHMKAHSGPLRCERVRYMEPRDYRQFVLEMDGTDALWK